MSWIYSKLILSLWKPFQLESVPSTGSADNFSGSINTWENGCWISFTPPAFNIKGSISDIGKLQIWVKFKYKVQQVQHGLKDPSKNHLNISKFFQGKYKKPIHRRRILIKTQDVSMWGPCVSYMWTNDMKKKEIVKNISLRYKQILTGLECFLKVLKHLWYVARG